LIYLALMQKQQLTCSVPIAKLLQLQTIKENKNG
jgi:hypothetical protein